MKIEKMHLDVQEIYYAINNGIYNKYDILAMASRIASKNRKDALRLLKLAENLYAEYDDPTFDALCESVYMHVLAEKMLKNELYYQGVFRQNCQSILGKQYQFHNKHNLHKKRPDAWVVCDGKEIPVEMKINIFNKSALEQLLYYMDIYGCDEGIAIGDSCNVELPDNIMFVELDVVKQYDI